MSKTADDYRAACRVIRAALSNIDCEQLLLRCGHSRQAIADAFSIGQAEDVVVEAFTQPIEVIRERLASPGPQQAKGKP